MTPVERATDLWTQLVIAMRADGLIAESVVQTGPATTAVLMGIPAPTDGLKWLPANIHPAINTRVIAINQAGELQAVKWCENRQCWEDAESNDSLHPIQKWSYIHVE